jgi:alkylation response protein AidB-like acyl-CoA dehydrogenase
MATAFAFDDEHEHLRASMRRFCESRSPSTEVRRLMATTEGYDPSVWAQMGGQLDVQGVAIPQRFRGAGLGHVELAIVLEEMGRVLFCTPYFATVVLAANALLCSGDDDACDAYLPGIATGETIATLALVEDGGRLDEHGVTLAARRSNGRWTIDGHKSFVLDGSVADLVLVAARSAAGVCLFAVDGEAEGLTRAALPTLDQTRKLARLEFRRTPARLIGTNGGGWPGLAATLDLAAVALAAEQVGGAQRCLEMTVEYAKVREQFGRPIGSFQAVKHRCADMLMQVESARAAAQYAAWAASADSPELPVAASLAKATCSEAYSYVAGQTIQLHGGIGFTWEHDAHLYFKRAESSRLLLGDVAHHRELLAQRISL